MAFAGCRARDFLRNLRPPKKLVSEAVESVEFPSLAKLEAMDDDWMGFWTGGKFGVWGKQKPWENE